VQQQQQQQQQQLASSSGGGCGQSVAGSRPATRRWRGQREQPRSAAAAAHGATAAELGDRRGAALLVG
jgi:hypothetical protein